MGTTPIPGVTYFATSAGWTARGRETLSVAMGATERAALVWGTYLPDSTNRGLLPGWDANNLTPGPTADVDGDIFLTGPDPLQADGVWRNRVFYGRVWFRAPGLAASNCWFAGWNPTFYCDLDGSGNIVAGSEIAGGVAGCIANAGTTVYQATVTDSKISTAPWKDPTVTTRPGGVAALSELAWTKRCAFSAGVRGGKITLTRVEICDVQDAFSFHQPRADAADPAFTRINYGYHHSGIYYYGPDWVLTTNGPHADGLQTQTGGDFVMYRTRIGGYRDQAAYDARPVATRGTSKDFFNAACTLKQQQVSDLNRITDFHITECILEGGGSHINHVYVSTSPTSWEGSTFTGNLCVRRTDGLLTINRATQFAAMYSNNRSVLLNASGWTDLGLAPVSNG